MFTPHPIQDRTDDEMRAYADAAFDEIVAAITTDSTSALVISQAAVMARVLVTKAPPTG